VGVPYTMSTYSFVDGTREIYAIFLHSCRQYQRFLFMKHDAEFAFFTMLNMWVVHLRSYEICTLLCMHYFECEVVQPCLAFRRIV
jgi:hypothetical protein